MKHLLLILLLVGCDSYGEGCPSPREMSLALIWPRGEPFESGVECCRYGQFEFRPVSFTAKEMEEYSAYVPPTNKDGWICGALLVTTLESTK